MLNQPVKHHQTIPFLSCPRRKSHAMPTHSHHYRISSNFDCSAWAYMCCFSSGTSILDTFSRISSNHLSSPCTRYNTQVFFSEMNHHICANQAWLQMRSPSGKMEITSGLHLSCIWIPCKLMMNL